MVLRRLAALMVLRRLAPVVCAGLLAASCASDGYQRSSRYEDSGSRALGSYLAGLYAGAIRDTRAAANFFGEALADDPENVVLLRRTFFLLVSDGRFGEAVPLAHRLVRMDRGAGISRLALAIDDLKQGKDGEGAARLKAIPRSGFNALLGPIAQAWSEAGRGKTDKAIELVSGIDDRTAFNAFRRLHLALLYEYANRYDEAERVYAKAVSTEGGGLLRIVQAYGRFLERKGERVKALALYDKFLARAPRNPILLAAVERTKRGYVPAPLVRNPLDGLAEALYAAGSALAQDRARESATIYLQLAIYARPNFGVARILLSDQFEAVGRWEDAIANYAKIDPSSVLGHEARLQIALNLDHLDRTEESVSLLRRMSVENTKSPQALVALADLLRARERYGEAAQEYDRAFERIGKLENRHWALFYARGVALERVKQWPRAEADFLKALELAPDQPMVLNYLGYSWIEKGVHIERAKEMIERAVEQRPDDGYIIDSLGWALYKLGEYKAATKNLEQAVELRPEDAVINDHLGDAYWRVGRRLEANFQWRHALTLGPAEDVEAELHRKLKKGLRPLTLVGDSR